MSSFGGTVKLTGESEYRKALSEISSNLKVLNSEMKAVTSEYDNNDKSVENLSAQNDVLNKKIDEQEKKVNVLKDALAKSKEETGENSETTKKWQTELNNAQADLNKLNREVETNAKTMEEAVSGTKEEAEAVEDFGEEAEKSGDKALSLGDIIKANLISDAIKGGLQALANGISAIGGAMSESLSAGAEYADNILTLSAQTGLSTDALEKYNAVAELTDVSMETLTKSMSKNIKSMSTVQNMSAEASVDMAKLAKAQADAEIATNGVAKAQIDYTEAVKKYGEGSAQAQKASLALENAQIKLKTAQGNVAVASKAVEPQMNAMTKAYAKLGVSVYDAEGNMRDGETVYWEVIDALKEMENETERDALGMEILGKSARELNTIIEMGSEGVAEYSQKAVDMGAVLGGEGLEALGAFDDQMQIFSSTTSSTGNILASAFAPAMTSALEGVNGLAGSFNGLLSAIISGDEGGIEGAMTMIQEQVSAMIENVSTMLPELVALASQIISTLIDVIAQNLPTIMSEGLAMLSSLLSGISSNLGEIMPVILSVIEMLTKTILENLPMLLDMGIKMLVSLIQGIASMLPDLIPLAIDALLNLVETLIDNIDLIIDAGIDLLFGLMDGLLEALPILIEKAPVIINKLLSAINENMPKLIEMGITLTIQLVGGLIKAIPQLIKAGGQLLAGLFEGLLNPERIWDACKALFDGVVGGIKKIFGIHSPSTVFKDEVGKNLALGLGEGFDDTMADVSADMANAIPTEFDADINTKMNLGSATSSMSTYEMMVSAFKQALTEVKVVMDDREMGGFITNTIERSVFA